MSPDRMIAQMLSKVNELRVKQILCNHKHHAPYSIFIKIEISGRFALKYRCVLKTQADHYCLNKQVWILM